jgi:hypothetical protein
VRALERKAHALKATPKSARLITFVGAGIVLATFVVKDMFSERLKEADDSLDGAQSLYLSQTYSSFMQDDLAYIKQQLDVTLATIQSGKDSTETHERILSAKAQASDDHLSVLTEYADNLLDRVAKIPQEAQRTQEARDLREQCSDLLQKVKNLRGQLPGLLAAVNNNPNDPKALGNLSDFVAETSPLPKAIDSVTVALGKLTKVIVTDLSERKAKIERQYEFTKSLSYVLFIAGWIVGLAGQVLGPAVSGE